MKVQRTIYIHLSTELDRVVLNCENVVQQRGVGQGD